MNAEELVKQWQNVHGLDGVPDESRRRSAGLRRQVWRGPDGRADH